MNLFKENPDPKDVFDRLILEEAYAEAFAYAIDNHIEREALKICIGYIEEDDEYHDQTPIDNDSFVRRIDVLCYQEAAEHVNNLFKQGEIKCSWYGSLF